MQQSATGQTRTQAGHSHPYGMWFPAQLSELNWLCSFQLGLGY